jgi:hypothetical protein
MTDATHELAMRAEMQQTLLFTAEQVDLWGRSIASICVRFPGMVVADLATVLDLLDQPEPDLERVWTLLKRLECEAKVHVIIGDQVAQKVGQSTPVRIDGGPVQ